MDVWGEHSGQSHEHIYLEPGTALCFLMLMLLQIHPAFLGINLICNQKCP